MTLQTPLRLMIPGPVTVDSAVLQAMGSPVQPHYGPAWVELYGETLSLLRDVYHTQEDIYLMAGSGTVAIDACIGSTWQSGEKIIVGTNGFFGERLIDIAQRYGLIVVPVRAEPGCPLTAGQFVDAFQQHPDARGAALVHLETSTTILNPIDQIGPAMADKGLLVMVDAVSSLGGVPFHLDEWKIDLCASATQKCLGAPPGLAPVAVSRRAWKAIDRQPEKQHGWFSDLRIWRKYAQEWGDWHPSPVTMPTNNVYALNVALHQLKEEGVAVRLERYQQLALRLRAGLERIGLRLYTPIELMTPVLTAAYTPAGIPSSKIVAYLEEQHNIKISTGLGAQKESLIRIGHMSPVVNEGDIDDVVNAIEEFLTR